MDLDIEYVNFDFAGEPYLDPDRAFGLQEPVSTSISKVLSAAGIAALHLISGRGHHFIWRVRRDSPVCARLVQLGNVPESLGQMYLTPHSPTGESVPLDLGRAFAGLGMVLEYVAQRVLAEAGPLSAIPVQMMAVEVGKGRLGREIVSFDISEYGDPLHTRHCRLPFSAYLKPQRARSDVGAHLVEGTPPLFEVPLLDLEATEAAKRMRRPEEAADIARRADVRIPDETDSMQRLVAEYSGSRLAEFHRLFYSETPHGPEAWPETYDRMPLDTLPSCVQTALRQPNDLLLKPAVVQHLVRVFTAQGWHPRHIAGLIWAAFSKDHKWGDRWLRMDPCWRAEFYARVYAGLLFTGVDTLVDLNCVSHQEKGFCDFGGCPHNLESYQHALRARSGHA